MIPKGVEVREAEQKVAEWAKDLRAQAEKAQKEMWEAYSKRPLTSRIWNTTASMVLSAVIAPLHAGREAYEAVKRTCQDVARDYNGFQTWDFVNIEGKEDGIVALRASARHYVKLVLACHMGDLEKARTELGWSRQNIDKYISDRHAEQKGEWEVKDGVLDISLLGGISVGTSATAPATAAASTPAPEVTEKLTKVAGVLDETAGTFLADLAKLPPVKQLEALEEFFSYGQRLIDEHKAKISSATASANAGGPVPGVVHPVSA